VNDDYELRPRDASFEQEDKSGLLKANTVNEAETAKRWKSAAADSSRIPSSVSQAYSGEGGDAPAQAHNTRHVSESFKTRTNQATTVPIANVALFLVILLVAGVFMGRYVLHMF
jgi:hypothetical protein